MNKFDFLTHLRTKLWSIPKEDAERSVEFYSEMIDDRMEEGLSEEEAVARMERTIAFQSAHDYHWTVVEKSSGQAIGWAGMRQQASGVWGETGIAIGPDFTGKGYGKQLLQYLVDYARDELGATKFLACCRPENLPSKRMQLSCGFTYTHSETVIHPRDQVPYVLDHYAKEL